MGTYKRNKAWKDDITLWTDNIANVPNKPGPWINRGLAYGKLGKWDSRCYKCFRATGAAAGSTLFFAQIVGKTARNVYGAKDQRVRTRGGDTGWAGGQ